MTKSSGRLALWRLRISKFDFNVVYRAGVKHQAAVALSCLQTTDDDGAPLKGDMSLLSVDVESDHTSILLTNANSNHITPLYAQEKKTFDTPPKLEELVVEQAPGKYCKAASLNMDHTRSKLHIDQQGRLVRKSTVDDSIQIGAQTSLRVRILYLAPHLPISGH